MNSVNRFISFATSFLLVFSLFFFTNCSSDGDDNENAKFVGTWSTSAIDMELLIGGVPFIQYLVDKGDLTQSEAALLEAFFKVAVEEEIGSAEIELRPDYTYVANFEDEMDAGYWSYDSSTGFLIIDSDDPGEDIQMIKVKSITSNTMIIEQSETVEEDVDDDGISEKIDASIEMTFIKS